MIQGFTGETLRIASLNFHQCPPDRIVCHLLMQVFEASRLLRMVLLVGGHPAAAVQPGVLRVLSAGRVELLQRPHPRRGALPRAVLRREVRAVRPVHDHRHTGHRVSSVEEAAAVGAPLVKCYIQNIHIVRNRCRASYAHTYIMYRLLRFIRSQCLHTCFLIPFFHISISPPCCPPMPPPKPPVCW